MKLNEYLKSQKLTVKDFAILIGVTEMSVYRYKNGTAVPATPVMAKIMETTSNQVGFADFIQTPQSEST